MIKKYRNRPLYDTDEGGYITTAIARERVLKGESVYPHASYDRTIEQVTADVLLDIIGADLAANKGPTPDDLRRFIEAYSTAR